MLTSIFIFKLLCGASEGFMKALKALMKFFEAPQRSARIKFEVNAYFNTTSSKSTGKGKRGSMGKLVMRNILLK